ncbi:MAG: hypothetical protein ACE5H2_05460, partial [Terriglobia bacterium]
MLTQTLWWACNALLVLLLIRSITGRFLTKYLLFYIYLWWVLLDSLVSFYLYVVKPGAYQSFYWYAEFLSVAVGYCVIWEIYTQALRDYAGAARMARRLLSVIYVVVLAKVLAHTISGSAWSLAETTAVLERNLRTVQAFLLVAILGLLVYYAIPVGRNLKGIILGYGFFVGTIVMSLTVRSYLGAEFQPVWQYLPAAAYFVTLLIWCATLWSYHPNPKPKTEIALERDYGLLAAQTTRGIAR